MQDDPLTQEHAESAVQDPERGHRIAGGEHLLGHKRLNCQTERQNGKRTENRRILYTNLQNNGWQQPVV